MKFACARCWDYDCNCTPEQLAEHYNKSIPPLPPRYKSKTLPNIEKGDMIVQGEVPSDWMTGLISYVTDVDQEGEVYVKDVSNIGLGKVYKLDKPYKVLSAIVGEYSSR